MTRGGLVGMIREDAGGNDKGGRAGVAKGDWRECLPPTGVIGGQEKLIGVIIGR